MSYFDIWWNIWPSYQSSFGKMSSSGIKDVLESNHALLVESLSQHANSVIEKAKTILNMEEQEFVDSRGTNEDKISTLLKRLATKDNDTCKNFIEMLIITMPCNSFPMCLENSLMASGEDTTHGNIWCTEMDCKL